MSKIRPALSIDPKEEDQAKEQKQDQAQETKASEVKVADPVPPPAIPSLLAKLKEAKAEVAAKVETKQAFLRVSSRDAKGFWRCGRHFSRTAVDLPVADLKKGELERLQKEPALETKLIEL